MKNKTEEKMKKKCIALLMIILAIVMTIPVGAVNADSTIPVSGTVLATTQEWTIEGISGQCMIGRIKNILILEGSLQGKAVEELSYCLDFSGSGPDFTGQGRQLFRGTVLGGNLGMYDTSVVHQERGDLDAVEESCEVTLVSAAGGPPALSGTLRFQLTHAGPGVWEGTYSGEVAP
jgi:hypothetical protein